MVRSVLLLVLTVVLASPAVARVTAPMCPLPPDHPPIALPLDQHSRAGALTVVAIGSSSTQGIGASSKERSYPAQLQALLQRAMPDTAVRVINQGIGGETVAANLRRFPRDVEAHRPDLVIWQVGTNDALRGRAPQVVLRELHDGIARLHTQGAAVVLMEAQFMPELETERTRVMLKAIRAMAAQQGVPLLRRHDLMRHWLARGALTLETLLSADRLHMTDASYRCLASSVARLVFGVSAGAVAADASHRG